MLENLSKTPNRAKNKLRECKIFFDDWPAASKQQGSIFFGDCKTRKKKTIETVFIFLVAAIDKPHLIARLNEMEKNVSEVRYKIVFN